MSMFKDGALVSSLTFTIGLIRCSEPQQTLH